MDSSTLRAALLLCLFTESYSKEKEPVCYSRFDYEEKLLEKTIRNGIQMEDLTKKLDSALLSIQGQKNALDQRYAKLETMMAEFKEKTSEIAQAKVSTNRTVVMFSARELVDASPSSGEVLKYKTVLYNIGNAYDSATGMFTAPVSGTYLFSVVLATNAGKLGRVGLYIGGKRDQTIIHHSKATTFFTTGSVSAIHTVSKGQSVFLKEGSAGHDYKDAAITGFNQFMGILLYQ